MAFSQDALEVAVVKGLRIPNSLFSHISQGALREASIAKPTEIFHADVPKNTLASTHSLKPTWPIGLISTSAAAV